MLGQALLFIFLLLLKVAQSKECPKSEMHNMVGFSGESLQLQLNCSPTEMEIMRVRWQIQWQQQGSNENVILTFNNKTLTYENWTSNHFNSRLDFRLEDFTLLIKKAQKQDTGLYQLKLTLKNGNEQQIQFRVYIYDKVEKPQLQGQSEILPGGKCRVFLTCLVSGADNVNFTWHRGREQIQGWKEQTNQEEVVINSSLVYTCNVSNLVSWANSTLNLTQACLNPFGSLPLVIISTVVPVTLVIIFTVCFCVRKKMKQSDTSQEQHLTPYECVNSVDDRRNQNPEQSPPEDMSTIYSIVQLQPSASRPQGNDKTLYSLVNTGRKSSASRPQENDKTLYSLVNTGRKKRNHDPSYCTVYEEVGNRQPRVQNTLTPKELENFRIYS